MCWSAGTGLQTGSPLGHPGGSVHCAAHTNTQGSKTTIFNHFSRCVGLTNGLLLQGKKQTQKAIVYRVLRNKASFTIIHLFDVYCSFISQSHQSSQAKVQVCFYFKFFYLIHHFKIQAQSGGGAETAHFPLARATNTHLLRKADNHRHCDELQ